jgi:hypothetical protein
MSTSVETAELDAIAQSLVAIVADANAGAANDVELERRVGLIVDSYLATPGTEETALKRAKLARALQQKCGGPGCTKVVAYILRDV